MTMLIASDRDNSSDSSSPISIDCKFRDGKSCTCPAIQGAQVLAVEQVRHHKAVAHFLYVLRPRGGALL